MNPPEDPPTNDPEKANEHRDRILGMIATELDFYRKRSGQVYLLAFTAEVFILAGRDKIVVPTTSAWWGVAVHVIFFLAVAVVSTLLVAEYRRRIHRLRHRRIVLLDHDDPLAYVRYGLLKPLPATEAASSPSFFSGKDGGRSELGVLLAALWVTSAMGILLSVVGERTPQRDSVPQVMCNCGSVVPKP